MRISGQLLPWLLGGALVASLAANPRILTSATDVGSGTASVSDVDAAIPEDETSCGMSAVAEMACGGGDIEACVREVRLCLTDEQRSAITGCCGGTCAAAIVDVEQVEHKLAELEAALALDPLDASRVQALADEFSDVWTRHFKASIHSILRVREALLPDQLELLAGKADEADEADGSTHETNETGDSEG